MSESTFKVGDVVTPVEPIENPNLRWLRPGVTIGTVNYVFNDEDRYCVFFKSSCKWIECSMVLHANQIQKIERIA